MVPFLRPYVDWMLRNESTYCEPFVGGGWVLLDVALRYPHLRLFVNDGDADLSAFWAVVAGTQRDTNRLCECLDITPTLEMYDELRTTQTKSTLDRAFRAVFFTRTSFSGLPTNSPVGGRAQKGRWTIASRYDRRRIVNAVQETHNLMKNRTSVSCEDALDFIARHAGQPLYADPPYFEVEGLYRVSLSRAQHVQMSRWLRGRNKWVLSYDDCAGIRNLYDWANVERVPVQYRINRKAKEVNRTAELVITP